MSAPKIAVTGMRVEFDDALVQPNAQFALTPVTLNVSGLNTAPGAKFTLDLAAKGEKTGDLKVHAETDLDFATLAAHVEGAIDTWRDAAVTLDVSSIEASAGDLPVRLAERPLHTQVAASRA